MARAHGDGLAPSLTWRFGKIGVMAATFGCALCYEGDAGEVAAFFSGGGLALDRLLIDDSHFIVGLRRCTACTQPYVSVFSEFVDWSGGDDAQYRDIVPLTSAEVDRLRALGEDLDPRYLGSLGEGRRRLSSELPSEGGRRVGWRTGAFRVEPGH